LAFICFRWQHISFFFGIEKRLINTNKVKGTILNETIENSPCRSCFGFDTCL
jgi:hypothetical protein